MRRALLAFWIATGLLAGCVSQSRYQALEVQTTAERRALEKELAVLRSDRQDLQQQKAAIEHQLAGLRDEVGRREAELAGVNKDLGDQRSELESQRDALQREIASLNERVAETEKRAAELGAQKDSEIKRLRGTYDSLVKNLEGEIAKGEIKVKQMRDKLSVQMVEKILFDSGKAEIKPQGREVLAKVATVLRTIKDKQIRIEGYTDSMPIGAALQSKFATNWELSTQRATVVLRFLQDKGGIDGRFLSAVGYGPHRPIASNNTLEGRAENRRIEIVLLPLDAPELVSEVR